MKKVILGFLSVFSLYACNTPTNANNSDVSKPVNPSVTPSSTPSTSNVLFKTKADFVTFWNCVIEVNKSKTPKEYFQGKIDLSKSIPDNEWNSSNIFVQSQTVDAEAMIKSGNANGCVK